jgi:hypothetical protein
MKPSESFDDFCETLHQVESRWETFRWTMTGPILIAIGVSQAIFGWAGNTWLMRFGYPTACITFGLLILAYMIRMLCSKPVDSDDPNAIVAIAARPSRAEKDEP